VKQGEVVRFWFTNAANTRTFNLSFSNARMKLVASDMSAFSRDEWVESVVIAPAERYAVDVRFDSPGSAVLVNRVRGIDHLFGDFLAESDTLGLVAVAGALPPDSIAVEFDSLATRAGASEVMARAVREAPEAPRHTLVFGLETRGLPFFTQRMMLLDSAYFHPAEWSGTMPMMNWATTGAQAHWFVLDAASGARNEAIAMKFRRGERARIRLVNQRNSIHAMQHPVHLHGQRFLVLAVNGVEPRTRAWKDTVLLPAGAAVDILVEFDNPGRWMLHCHIAEHLQSSMMLFFDVLGN
jgi:FtsP/CotA-like multicopper oxidase with cupredoxin domain